MTMMGISTASRATFSRLAASIVVNEQYSLIYQCGEKYDRL